MKNSYFILFFQFFCFDEPVTETHQGPKYRRMLIIY